jgi:hypothetical protein
MTMNNEMKKKKDVEDGKGTESWLHDDKSGRKGQNRNNFRL